MSDAVIRTEDLNPEEIKNYFVETCSDREIVDSLKNKQPMLLVGSRGTGKTMLMRVAEREISEGFAKNRILPVFVNLSSCSMYSENSILSVIISRTLISLQKSLRDHGIIVKGKLFEPILNMEENPIVKKLERYINETTQITDEETKYIINNESIKRDVALLKDFLLQLCEEFSIDCIMFLFDEACQVFRPKQQRIFFDFFRALREYYIVCKAAVYPGIISYGSFQKFHDATIKQVERSIISEDYLIKMRDIVQKNFPSDYSNIISQGELLNNIIFYASGNPRLLIKSINEILSDGGKFQTKRATEVIKEFYGTTIWSEHTKLSEMYSGHTEMINWARNFIENVVLPSLHKINDDREAKKTIYFLISRNAPEVIRQSIKTLEYSGIVSLHTEGFKRRYDTYDRYELNLGVVVLSEKQPNISKRGMEIATNLSITQFSEYGANSPLFGDYSKLIDITKSEHIEMDIINNISNQNIDVLELSDNMKKKLHDYGYNTVNDILLKNEDELRNIPYVGLVRSRIISNVVINAILEYISG